jgi:hypothetical protein
MAAPRRGAPQFSPTMAPVASPLALNKYPAVEVVWSHLSAAQRQVFHPASETTNVQELLFQSQAALAKQKEAQAAIEADLKATREAWKTQKAALVRRRRDALAPLARGPRRSGGSRISRRRRRECVRGSSLDVVARMAAFGGAAPGRRVIHMGEQ